MIERNIARMVLPKMLVSLFVVRVDDDQTEESRETTKEARCSRRDSPSYFLPHPNLGSLISGSCFNPSAIPAPASWAPFAMALPASCAMCAAWFPASCIPVATAAPVP